MSKMAAFYLSVKSYRGPDIGSLAWLTGTPEWNGAIFSVIIYTGAFPSLTSLNV